MPTLCQVASAELPAKYPGDGSSILPLLQNNARSRKKEWIYIWYRGRVMVRNKQYSLVARANGRNARFTRYKGPFDGEKLADAVLSEAERRLKRQFEATLARLRKTRLSSVSKAGRAEAKKGRKRRRN